MQTASFFLTYYATTVARLAVRIFRNFLLKRIISEDMYLTWNVCFDFLYNSCLNFFSFSGSIRQGIIINVLRYSGKVPGNLSDFTETWPFTADVDRRPEYL